MTITVHHCRFPRWDLNYSSEPVLRSFMRSKSKIACMAQGEHPSTSLAGVEAVCGEGFSVYSLSSIRKHHLPPFNPMTDHETRSRDVRNL